MGRPEATDEITDEIGVITLTTPVNKESEIEVRTHQPYLV
jgi:hypothetical protein